VEDEAGHIHKKFEEGNDDEFVMKLRKYQAKKKFAEGGFVEMCYYDHQRRLDVKDDEFLQGLSPGEKQKFDEALGTRQKDYGNEGEWGMIMEGGHVGLYQDYCTFKAKRDKPFREWMPRIHGGTGWSWKAGKFQNLAEATMYVQMNRDEEGVHNGWPRVMPVYWSRGNMKEWNKIDGKSPDQMMRDALQDALQDALRRKKCEELAAMEEGEDEDAKSLEDKLKMKAMEEDEDEDEDEDDEYEYVAEDEYEYQTWLPACQIPWN